MKHKFKNEKDYIAFLKEADRHYYVFGDSLYSDDYYDQVKDEFTRLYPNSEYLSSIGHLEEGSLVLHENHMGSQFKVNSYDELLKWASSIEKDYNITKFFYSEKLDGCSVSLKYEDGKLVQSLSRGDGVKGLDITNSIIHIKEIPKNIDHKGKLNIRGEVVILKDDFEKLIQLEDFKHLTNLRNAATGLIKKADPKGLQFLSFFAFDITDDLDIDKKFHFLIKNGFNIPKHKNNLTIDEIQSLWEEYEKKQREESLYEMDGLIISVNQKKMQDSIGIIQNKPKYSRAYKFTPIRKQSVIEDIVWQVGKTGRVTPVAKIAEVNIGGAKITNVTLNNIREMKTKKISIGSIIEIQRSGDVIPKLESVLKSNGTPSIINTCPECSTQLIEEDVFLMCNNPDCVGKTKASIMHWINVLDIKGISYAITTQLVDLNIISSPLDLYGLTLEKLIKVPRLGEKNALKILKAINEKKSMSMPIFLKAYGISNFGENVGKLLIANNINTIDQIMNLTSNDISEIKGIGSKTIDALTSFKNEKDIILEYLKVIIIINDQLSETNFVFTGFRNQELENKIKQKGYSISNTVNKKTIALIALDVSEQSSKIEKANKIGIPIINKNDFDVNNY